MTVLFICQVCGEGKRRSGFYPSTGTKTCRPCFRARVTVRRRTDPAVQAYDRMRDKTPERRAARDATTKRWQKANPEKYTAQNILHGKIWRGEIKRQPCIICGEKGHAHHHDYSKPLDVVWLCPLHHHRGHADGTI